jgi:DNA (cytosine-5)-methyltransferase 1
MSLRIGSLFTGTGALDLAVMDVFDAEVVWHSQYEPPDKNGKEDKNQYAAKILAHHWPTVPNLGDVTAIDWPAVIEEHGPVDIVTGGFPCTDVSSAGQRAGLTPDTRSGLWTRMAHAISILQPRLVIIENVEGLLSAPADRGLGLDAEALEEEARAGRILRALGAVLGDLASIGFDAEWARVAASEVGAPHGRKRVFIYAWPAALDAGGLGRGDGPRILGRLGTAGRGAEASADAADLGHERGRDARDGWTGPANSDLAPADPGSTGLEVGRVEPDRHELPTAERGGRESAADTAGDPRRFGDGNDVRAGGGADGLRQAPGGGAAADTDSIESERRGVAGVLGSQAAAEPCEGDQRERAGDAARDSGEAATDADGRGREGHQERDRGPEDGQPQGERGLDAVGRGVRRAAPTDTDQLGRRADVLDLRPGQPDLDWGAYGPAIRRWETILGRPAPWPTDALGRLSPVFTEWLMGLPDGWVTDTPGLTRPAMLRALGNGVVRQQAAAALRLLHQRAAEPTQQAA